MKLSLPLPVVLGGGLLGMYYLAKRVFASSGGKAIFIDVNNSQGAHFGSVRCVLLNVLPAGVMLQPGEAHFYAGGWVANVDGRYVRVDLSQSRDDLQVKIPGLSPINVVSVLKQALVGSPGYPAHTDDWRLAAKAITIVIPRIISGLPALAAIPGPEEREQVVIF